MVGLSSVMPSDEKQFWIAITLLGSGVALIGAINQTSWGVCLTFIAGLWLLYLERDHIRTGVRHFVGGAESGRPELSKEQRDRLLSQISVLQVRAVGIARDGLPDCVRLADQLHALFGSLGWPSAFLPEQKSFEGILPGVRIISKPDDRTAVEVRRILSEVLEISIGEVIERTKNIDWFEIEIGRMPF